MGRKEKLSTEGVVYLISFPNGKYYVGITSVSFEERKRSHLSHMCTSDLPVHKALKKYQHLVNIEIIDKANTREQLNDLEIKYIKKYDSHIDNNGYNLTLGGGGTVGYRHSGKSKLNNSSRRKKYFKNPVNRKKQSRSTKLAHRNNPNQAIEHAAFQKERYKKSSERKKTSKGMKRYLSNSENRKTHSVQRGAKPFLVFDGNGELVGEWLAQNQCAGSLDLDVSHINHCLKGRRKSHKGYFFRYKYPGA
jgi:group I intron endonuclease